MTVVRDFFTDGLILSAAQLHGLAEIPRARAERHGARVHRPGIVTGLGLVSDPAEDSFGNAYARVFLQPGMAIDGYGRELLVTTRIELPAARFRLSIGNSIAEETDYPVFVVSEYRAREGQGGGFGACGAGNVPMQVEERVEVRYGQPGDERLEQLVPPLSDAPTPGEGSTDWLVFVGYVRWSAAATNFAEITDAMKEDAAKVRVAAGIDAATVAGDDSRVQIQPKGDLLVGDTVLQVSQTAQGPELCFGTFSGAGKPIEPLLKVTGKGDVVAKGALTGKRTGNSVQIESGTASDGMILPLPPGVSQKQVDDGDATLHVQVSPHIDPAAAPIDPANPDLDFAALIQECRVDADRRVHCRIIWFAVDLVTASFAAPVAAGPGAVDFIVAAATSETSQ